MVTFYYISAPKDGDYSIKADEAFAGGAPVLYEKVGTDTQIVGSIAASGARGISVGPAAGFGTGEVHPDGIVSLPCKVKLEAEEDTGAYPYDSSVTYSVDEAIYDGGAGVWTNVNPGTGAKIYGRVAETGTGFIVVVFGDFVGGVS